MHRGRIQLWRCWNARPSGAGGAAAVGAHVVIAIAGDVAAVALENAIAAFVDPHFLHAIDAPECVALRARAGTFALFQTEGLAGTGRGRR